MGDFRIFEVFFQLFIAQFIKLQRIKNRRLIGLNNLLVGILVKSRGGFVFHTGTHLQESIFHQAAADDVNFFIAADRFQKCRLIQTGNPAFVIPSKRS